MVTIKLKLREIGSANGPIEMTCDTEHRESTDRERIVGAAFVQALKEAAGGIIKKEGFGKIIEDHGYPGKPHDNN